MEHETLAANHERTVISIGQYVNTVAIALGAKGGPYVQLGALGIMLINLYVILANLKNSYDINDQSLPDEERELFRDSLLSHLAGLISGLASGYAIIAASNWAVNQGLTSVFNWGAMQISPIRQIAQYIAAPVVGAAGVLGHHYGQWYGQLIGLAVSLVGTRLSEGEFWKGLGLGIVDVLFGELMGSLDSEGEIASAQFYWDLFTMVIYGLFILWFRSSPIPPYNP